MSHINYICETHQSQERIYSKNPAKGFFPFGRIVIKSRGSDYAIRLL